MTNLGTWRAGLLLGPLGVLCLAWGLGRPASAPPPGTVLMEGLQGRPGVLVVFQLADCPTSRAGLERWSDLLGSTDLAVAGMLVDPPDDADIVRRAVAEIGLPFEVHLDKSGKVARALVRLGYRRTPVVLAFDETGRLVLASHAHSPQAVIAVRLLLGEKDPTTGTSPGATDER